MGDTLMAKKKAKITKAMESLYLKRQGLRCLYCGSEELSGGELTLDGPIGWANVQCINCEREWVDRYELTGVTEAEVHDPSPTYNDCCPICGAENDTEESNCAGCQEVNRQQAKLLAKRRKK